MATLKKIYADLDLTFTRNPGTGDVSMSYDEQSVIRSVRNLLMTNFYERPFQPTLGSNLNAFLFEQISAITASSIETEIKNVVNNFEPRVSIALGIMMDSESPSPNTTSLAKYISG